MNQLFKLTLFAAAALLSACSDSPSDASAGPTGPTITSGLAPSTKLRTVTVDGVQQPVADRELLVVLDEDVSPAQYDAVIAALKAQRVERVGQLQDLRLLQVTLADNDAEAAVLGAVRGLPGVARASYNFVVESARANPPMLEPPADIGPPRVARRLEVSSNGRYWVDQIGLPQAWAVEDALAVAQAGRIAVVDTGMPASQNVLAETRLVRVDAAGGTLTDDATFDDKTHGLWVSAFAAGSSADASGVSRRGHVLSVDVYRDQCTGVLAALGCPLGIGRMFFTDLAEGTRTAVLSSARVVNVSWGAKTSCDLPEATRLRLQREFREMMKPLVNLARRNDKLMVLASGNDCEKRDDQLLTTAGDVSTDSWLSHALIVGASTAAGRDALFGRMGAVVNLVAPGDTVGWGQGTGNGTSYAAPLVAGTASLLQGINSELSAPETRYLLLNGAEATIRFSNMQTANYRGYVGGNAVGPALQLNAGNSAEAARLTREAPLKTLDTQRLSRGQTSTVSFDVDIPSTGVRALDVVFVVDVSGSYRDDIATLRLQASGIVDALVARGLDVQFGVTEFADFPRAPYGSAGDLAFRRLARVTGDKATVLNGINALTLKDGNDEPESQLEALFQVATGRGRDLNGDGTIDRAAGDLASEPVGWRTGAAKVVLFATDASFHDADTDAAYPGAGFNATVDALKAQGIKVIALQSGNTGGASADIARLVSATGGAAHQLNTDSSRVADAVAAGIDTTLAEVDVTVEKIAGAEWFTQLTQDKTTARPGEKVRFTAELTGRRNASVDDLKYDLYLWVRANGSALLQRVRIPVQVAR